MLGFKDGSVFLILALLGATVQAEQYLTFDNLNIITDVVDNLEFTTYFVFSVKACNDATIHLTDTFGYYSGQSYNVAIGALGNTVTSYMECWNCVIHSQRPTPAIVDCAYTKQFWVSWDDAHLRIGQGWIPNMNQIFNTPMDESYKVRYVGFSTGNGATGVWNVPEEMYLNIRSVNDYVYTDLGSLKGLDSMSFNVTSCGNALVSIGQERGIDAIFNLFEIVIDNAGNSSIRNCHKCAAEVTTPTPNLLQCTTPVPLWVGFEGPTVYFGTGLRPYEHLLLNWTSSDPPRNDYLSVSGSPTSGASWTFARVRYEVIYDTSDGYAYYDIGWVGGETYILFEEIGCSNAAVVIGNQRGLNFATSSFYEYSFGSNNDTTCVLRKCILGVCNILNQVSCTPLSCDASNQFWIMWDEQTNYMAMGAGWYPGTNVMMKATDSAGLLPQQFGGISTGAGYTGVWHFPRANDVTRNTPKELKYVLAGNNVGSLGNGTYFTFSVAAFSDAIVALDQSVTNDAIIFQGYQIIIGGNSNTQTVIKRCNSNVCSAVGFAATANILDIKEARKFWISYGDGYVSVGTGWAPGVNTLASYVDGNPWTVNFIRVSTDVSSFGHWSFPDGGCYRQVDVGGNLANPNLCVVQ